MHQFGVGFFSPPIFAPLMLIPENFLSFVEYFILKLSISIVGPFFYFLFLNADKFANNMLIF